MGAGGYLYFSGLNLYYAHGRWYNPVNALWLSPNEKGDYLYGGDDPGQNAVNKVWEQLQVWGTQAATTVCEQVVDCEDVSAIASDVPAYLNGAGHQFLSDQTFGLANTIMGSEWQQSDNYAFYRGQQGGRNASQAVSTLVTIKGVVDIGIGTTTGGGAVLCTALTAGGCTPLSGPVALESVGQTALGYLESKYGTDVLTYAKGKPLPSGKPLTPDEQKWIGRINSIPQWLKDHPDLARDAKLVNSGVALGEHMDHVKEAGDYIRMLNKGIAHFKLVYWSRSAAAQAQITSAIEAAEQYRQMLEDILATR